MNEVRKLYNDDGCVLKEASSNDYESWSSARTLGPMERRKKTETYVIILNMSGELISLTVQRKVYVMRIANT